MIRFHKIKEDIKKIDNPIELAGYLDGIRVAAALYCKENYPDEVIFENGKLEDISVYGMKDYLESEITE